MLFPAIDCMLGGGRQGARIAARPLTDIELRLAARISGLFLRQLRAAWHDVVEFEPSVERVACSPHVSGIAQAGDAVIWTRFDVEFGPARGTLNLAIPIDSVQSLLARLASEPTAGPAVPPQPNPASDGNGATVELVACLARLRVSADDVRQLAVGDVITTEQRVDAPIEVLRDGKVQFRARAGAAAGHKAIEIDQVVCLPPDAAPRRP
jgi:flagellar motor switch protein FliM